MQSLEKAIRLALELGRMPITTNTVSASAKFKSTPNLNQFNLEKCPETNRKAIYYETSFQSQTCETIEPDYSKNSGLLFRSYSSTQKAGRYSKPEYVYWIHNEIEKWRVLQYFLTVS